MTSDILKGEAFLSALSAYIPDIRKSGANYIARCPCHADKSPSLSISAEKGLVCCHACHRPDGNIFQFIAAAKDITIAEAKAMIKGERHANPPSTNSKLKTQNSKLPSGEISIETLNGWKEGLFSPAGKQGLEWCLSRWNSEAFIRGKNIGYCAKRNALVFWDYSNQQMVAFRRLGENGKFWFLPGCKPSEALIGGDVLNEVAEGEVLYLAEGLSDTLTLSYCGLKAVGLYGAGMASETNMRRLEKVSQVIIAFDNDTAGKNGSGKAGTILKAMFPAMTIKILNWPEGTHPKYDISDWVRDYAQPKDDLTARLTGSALADFIEEHSEETKGTSMENKPTHLRLVNEMREPGDDTELEHADPLKPTEVEQDRRKVIFVTTDWDDVLNQMERHLFEENIPVYNSSGLVVTVATNDISKGVHSLKIEGLQNPTQTHSRPVDIDWLARKTCETIHWKHKTKTGVKSVPPPKELLKTFLGYPKKIRPLIGITSLPAILKDGEIVRQGYDKECGIWGDYTLPKDWEVKSKPTRDDAIAALKENSMWLADFPFANQPLHTAVNHACTMAAVARYAIDGPVPGFAITAHSPGSGKTLLALSNGILITGRPPMLMPPAKDEDEMRKRLISIALSGVPCFVIDNVSQLGGSALNAIMTSTEISDRLLGTNKTVTAPWRALVMTTGLNLLLRDETSRRFLVIEIDPSDPCPEKRGGFSIQLPQWIEENRMTVIKNYLTALRAYFEAGMPRSGEPPIGSYESFSQIVRDCLIWCGYDDVSQSTSAYKDKNVDPELSAIEEIVTITAPKFKTPTTIKEYISALSPSELIEIETATGNTGKPKNVAQSLAIFFRRYQRRYISGYRIFTGGKSHGNTKTWIIRPA